MVLTRVLGWVLILSGLFIVIAMPSITRDSYMPENMSNSIVLVGIVLLAMGIFLAFKT